MRPAARDERSIHPAAWTSAHAASKELATTVNVALRQSSQGSGAAGGSFDGSTGRE